RQNKLELQGGREMLGHCSGGSASHRCRIWMCGTCVPITAIETARDHIYEYSKLGNEIDFDFNNKALEIL
ncbi:hypothetical protein ACCS78_34160, partial [Rhizobium johnstonii]